MEIPKISEESGKGPLINENKIDANRFQSITTDISLIAVCIIAAVVSFWDMSITIASVVTVGWMSVLLYIVTTSVYRSKYDGGIYKGRQTEEYKTALATFNRFRDHIMEHSLTDKLAEWCNTYRANDLTQIKKNIVCPYMTYQEFQEKYENISKEKAKSLGLSRQAQKAVNTANAIKPLELSADMLLNTSASRNIFGKRRALPTSGSTQREIDLATNYISKFVVTFICGMFTIQVLSSPSLESFLQWIVRMFPVVMAFLTGEPNGYKNVVSVDTRRILAQTHILKLFFADEKIDLPAAEQSIDI